MDVRVHVSGFAAPSDGPCEWTSLDVQLGRITTLNSIEQWHDVQVVKLERSIVLSWQLHDVQLGRIATLNGVELAFA